MSAYSNQLHAIYWAMEHGDEALAEKEAFALCRARVIKLEQELAEARAERDEWQSEALRLKAFDDGKLDELRDESARLRKALEEAAVKFDKIERLNPPMRNGLTHEIAYTAKKAALASAEKGDAS